MSKKPTVSLTGGRVDVSFDEAVVSIQNYGFRQSVFEVERLGDAENDVVGEIGAGQVVVLRPGSTPAEYPQMKLGDTVRCLGLRPDAKGQPALYKIRRMAEGTGRTNMTERAGKGA